MMALANRFFDRGKSTMEKGGGARGEEGRELHGELGVGVGDAEAHVLFSFEKLILHSSLGAGPGPLKC